MTDDLVKRLREGACLHNQLEAYDLTTEAADRIEQLEAALRVIVQVWDTDQPISIAKAALARDTARQVLKEKKDDIQNHD